MKGQPWTAVQGTGQLRRSEGTAILAGRSWQKTLEWQEHVRAGQQAEDSETEKPSRTVRA
jgi:hypothetical protein